MCVIRSFVDVDAWAADRAGADYRILVLRRDPVHMLRSNICRSHYHVNKYVPCLWRRRKSEHV
jgi:hypothetical protein